MRRIDADTSIMLCIKYQFPCKHLHKINFVSTTGFSSDERLVTTRPHLLPKPETKEKDLIDKSSGADSHLNSPNFKPTSFTLGDTVADYLFDPESALVGLRLYPVSLQSQVLRHREWMEEPELVKLPPPMDQCRANPVESLVQVKWTGAPYPPGYSQGRSLRNSSSTLEMKFERQEIITRKKITKIHTFLRSSEGYLAEHILTWHKGSCHIEITTHFCNASDDPVTLEMLSSFSLSGITPFHSGDAPDRLLAHRIRSAWSYEGRMESRSIEDLHLERSWQGHAVRSERFGQVGSLPCNGFFPFAAVEDQQAGVCWGAQLAWNGSWQMEFYRKGDTLALSGGMADREMGHWLKTLKPGETLCTPTAIISVVRGSVDDLCHRLTQAQIHHADSHPQIEWALPIICNEFCTTWGNPTHKNLEALAMKLQGTPVKYLVIDAGWYGTPGKSWFNAHGDWTPDSIRFPLGIAETSKMIRSYGLIPGIWFEMEVAGSHSRLFFETDHLLKRDGEPITVAERRFLDLRDPWSESYLDRKVLRLLQECDFGYLKVDYNETIGLGVDGAESLGEGLRQNMEGTRRFFEKLRREMPDLVIESCSSGGHRLEPLMLSLSSMSSFSDAHETKELPIIAANMHRVMLPRQSQIWAVLRKEDDTKRLTYSLSATFLGRMCLSGDLHDLNLEQWELTLRAQKFYERIAHIIKEGRSLRYGPEIASYRHPKGWQAVLRLSENGKEALLVAHSFEQNEKSIPQILLPGEGWKIKEIFSTSSVHLSLTDSSLTLSGLGNFEGAVFWLAR